MARPSKNLKKRLPDVRISDELHARIPRDAAECGLSVAEYVRQKFDGEPKLKGRGMPRPDLLRCFAINASVLKAIGGMNAKVDQELAEQAELILKALQDEH